MLNLKGRYSHIANSEHIKILNMGVKAWNKWRHENDEIRPDFDGANLGGVNLAGEDTLLKTFPDLAVSELVRLSGVKLFDAYLFGTNLSGSNLLYADLSGACLSKANLAGAELIGTSLVGTNLENADLNGCRIYGISAWNVRTNQKTKQSNLIITRRDDATVTVDDLEVAQFIYLLLNRKRLQDVLNTVTSLMS
jgi:uncharacterized protein YjbI with pentapeptide repeats